MPAPKQQKRAAQEREKRLDALMWEPSDESDLSLCDSEDDEEMVARGYSSGSIFFGMFAIDKK